MQEILFDYKLNPTTWAYISALMMVGIYFKFQRFLSVRNLDLIGLIAFSPGLLLVYHGLLGNNELLQTGYVWLFAVSLFFLIRLLLDAVMVRRPLLDPNLSAGGLTFTGASLVIFLMANVITCPEERLEVKLARRPSPASAALGFAPFQSFADVSDQEIIREGQPRKPPLVTLSLRAAACHAVTILAHLAVLAGMIWIGFRHFGNFHTGVAAATLYLLSFSTSQLTGQVEYVAPASLLVWAVAVYHRPALAGALIGIAAGLIFYPLFLFPLWCGFYWRRGAVRFTLGMIGALAAMALLLVVLAPDLATFADQLRQMFGIRNPFTVPLSGFWEAFEPAYRIPAVAAFAVLCIGLAIWPPHKNLGTLLSCTAAVMLATQFWHADRGGLCMGWYLPLLILTIFRPNLEDRIALSAVTPAPRRKR